MADLSVYVVLGLVIVPPILKQARAIVVKSRTHRPRHPSQPVPPSFLSKARLTPFSTPFATAVSVTALLLVLISIRNLVPVQYGIDLFVPSATIDAVRTSVYTLYTAPSSHAITSGHDNAPLHLTLLRGGYRPDLFLAYDAPITIPTTVLRDLIDMAGSMLPIGYHTEQRQLELQALIARLSSYEGRRMYLLLGPRPLTDCTFCKSGIDYFWYALPFLWQAYAWRILAIGLLTAHPDDSIAIAIRQLSSFLRIGSRASGRRPTQNDTGSRRYEADRSGWRSTAVTCLGALMVVEMLIMWEFGQVSAQDKRLNHWHCNLHLLRQLVFFSLVVVIYLWPSPRTLSSFEQTIHHLDSTQQKIQSLVHIAEMIDISRSLVLEQQDLVDISRRWKSNRRAAGQEPDHDRILRIAQSLNGNQDAIAHMSREAQQLSQVWFQNVESINQELDQRERIAFAQVHQQHSPSAPSRSRS
ncbi:hypothetical protein BCV70DRAFT_143012, partial [Testicularia cyperi]